MNRDIEKMLSVTAEMYNEKQNRRRPVNCMGKGMAKHLYAVSSGDLRGSKMGKQGM